MNKQSHKELKETIYSVLTVRSQDTSFSSQVTLTSYNDSSCLEIPIVDDSIALEGDEIFLVALQLPQLGDRVQLGMAEVTLTVTDNDSE